MTPGSSSSNRERIITMVHFPPYIIKPRFLSINMQKILLDSIRKPMTGYSECSYVSMNVYYIAYHGVRVVSQPEVRDLFFRSFMKIIN
jgi:hypothetical protein